MKLKYSIFLILFLISFTCVSALPVTYYGQILIDGEEATDIALTVETNLETYDFTVNSDYYTASVEGDYQTTTSFYIFGELVEEVSQPKMAAEQELNLSFNKLDNGEDCEQDAACISGKCCGGTCKSHCSSGGGGGGGGSYTPPTTPVTEEQTPITEPVIPPVIPEATQEQQQEQQQNQQQDQDQDQQGEERGVVNEFESSMGEGESNNFNAGGESHTTTVLGVNEEEGTADIMIESTPQYFTLSIGQEISVDLNADSLTDLMVKLAGISNGKADLLFKEIGVIKKEINTPTQPAPRTVTVASQDTNKITGAFTGAAGSSAMTYIIVVVVIAIGLFFFSRSYGGMPWTSRTDRATNFHKRAFECHSKGNIRKADALRRKAQKLREKDFNFNF